MNTTREWAMGILEKALNDEPLVAVMSGSKGELSPDRIPVVAKAVDAGIHLTIGPLPVAASAATLQVVARDNEAKDYCRFVVTNVSRGDVFDNVISIGN